MREEQCVRRDWKMLVVLAIVVAVGLSVVAVAVGASKTQLARRGAGAACGALMSDPAAAQAMSEPRAEHRAEMGAWSEKYGPRPTSAEARRALQTLRKEHWRDMQALFGKYGIKAPENGRPGGGGCGGLGSGGGCGAGAQGAAYGTMGSGGGMMGGWSY
jgi:hypothetical protein